MQLASMMVGWGRPRLDRATLHTNPGVKNGLWRLACVTKWAKAGAGPSDVAKAHSQSSQSGRERLCSRGHDITTSCAPDAATPGHGHCHAETRPRSLVQSCRVSHTDALRGVFAGNASAVSLSLSDKTGLSSRAAASQSSPSSPSSPSSQRAILIDGLWH